MAATVTNQGLPAPSLPFVDPWTGVLSPVWYQFLSSLWQRSGGGSGLDHSITVNSSNGIISSVSDPGGNATITLSLGGISPTSINCNGAITGASGNFNTGLNVRGNMQFGNFVGSMITNNGYVTILDNAGNARQLMVGS